MKLGTKLLGGFLAVTLILLVVGLFGIYTEVQNRNTFSALENKSIPRLTILNKINAERLRIKIELTEIGVIQELTPDSQQAIQAIARRWDASWQSIDEVLARYQTLELSNPQDISLRDKEIRAVEELRSNLQQIWALVPTLINATDQYTFSTTHDQYLAQLDASDELISQIGNEIRQDTTNEFHTINEAIREVSVEAQRAIVLYSIAIVLGVIISVALGVLITRGTLRQLGGEPTYASEIVNRISKGDFTGKIALKSGDRTSLLASMSRMSADIRNVLREVSTAGSQVAAASTELSANVEEASHELQAQQSEVDQVATAMNEMTSTVEEVARNAATAAEAADEADAETSTGDEIIKKAISSINRLANEIREASGVISQLSTDSQEIGDVLDVIRSVADQTNLLALNAAIEAARAGEQGRGFAVVADEVRTLASRTQASIQDIQGKIERVQSGSSNAVQVMDQSQTMAATVVDQAEQAGGALDRISSSITSITDMNRQIASAAEEQNAVAEEINRNLQTIAGAANQIRTGADQSSTASNELARLAELMADKLSHFKV